MKYILLILFVSTLLSQSKYPVDTLVQSTKINILKKIGLLPISMWQRISYNSNYFNCQFYPSCSNYCAKALGTGLARGVFWKDIEVVNNQYGKPFIKLHGKARIIFKNMNKTSNTQIEVSLSDEKKYAIANVTIYD